MSNREAATDLQINDLIKKRWSPRVFSDKKVSRDQLKAIFEAARSGPSSFNEQPWRFLIGIKGESLSYEKIFLSLTESNQQWAKSVPVLVVICAKKNFTKIEKNNRHYAFDAGQAAAILSIQATALDLAVHQMGGFSPDKIRSAFIVPEEFEPLTAVAIGYHVDFHLIEGETKPRERKPLSEICLEEEWGRPFFSTD